MPNSYLPPETLDYTIDLLYDEPDALKRCCLVSKSWVPRTRKHLFADVNFRSPSDLESWKKTFPDVANSPAYYARALLIGYPQPITTSSTEEGGWIRAFSRLRSLDLDNGNKVLRASDNFLAPFHKISLMLKSLRVGSTLILHPGLLDLICSFPLLEDLSLKGHDRWLDDDDPHGSQTITPSTSPALTGSLDFHILGGVGKVARLLLELPNGLHFRKLTLSWDHVTDPSWIAELVVRCSHTLESLDITHTFLLGIAGSVSGTFDLSRATKLHDLVFRPEWKTVEWITTTLQTITPEHQELRQISIHVPSWVSSYGVDIKQSLGEDTLGHWSDLDRLLLQFWESHLILPKVEYVRPKGNGQITEYCIGCLFPEMTKSGLVDLPD